MPHNGKLEKLCTTLWGASLNKLIPEYYVTDEWCNTSKFQVDTIDTSLSNSTPMDLLNATEDSSLCTRPLSSLSCFTLVCSDRLCFCSL